MKISRTDLQRFALQHGAEIRVGDETINPQRVKLRVLKPSPKPQEQAAPEPAPPPASSPETITLETVRRLLAEQAAEFEKKLAAALAAPRAVTAPQATTKRRPASVVPEYDDEGRIVRMKIEYGGPAA